MEQNALDYRTQYANGYHNPYARNPLSVGQWLMIGAGALAVGGVGYWIYAKVKSKKSEVATNGATNGTPANNPYHWHNAAA